MTEKLLQFIWQFQYFNRSHVRTTQGEPLTIVFPGRLNSNQGPDFLDAKIRIGETLFAGSVELHLKTSDWLRHGHQQDKNYNNVILHVVLQHDQLFQNHILVLERFEETGHHWEETFWRLLARNFGIKVNADAFEELAQTISIKLLARHRSSIH